MYSWTVGYEICDDEIHPHHDPHKHLLSSSSWNNKGIISAIPEAHNPLPGNDVAIIDIDDCSTCIFSAKIV